MEIVIQKNQQVFIEVTNCEHGGAGWEIGKCLWSPEKSINGRDCWKSMRELQKEDIVIHSVKSKQGHNIIGTSRVKSPYTITDIEPTCANRWANRGRYYRVDLQDYKSLNKTVYMQDFLDANTQLLRPFKKSFFTKNLKPAQKYVSRLDPVIANIITKYLGI